MDYWNSSTDCLSSSKMKIRQNSRRGLIWRKTDRKKQINRSSFWNTSKTSTIELLHQFPTKLLTISRITSRAISCLAVLWKKSSRSISIMKRSSSFMTKITPWMFLNPFQMYRSLNILRLKLTKDTRPSREILTNLLQHTFQKDLNN